MNEKKISLKNFFALFLLTSLVSLLSLIPLNLNMRLYSEFYSLVPFCSALHCCFLMILIPFPFLSLARKRINNSAGRYKYLTKKSYLHLFFIITIPISLIIVWIVNIIDPSFNFEPLILSSISIPLSYISVISTLIILESISQQNNQIEESTKKQPVVLSWTIFSLVIFSAITQSFSFFSFIVFGFLAAYFIFRFIVEMIFFRDKENEKDVDTPFLVSKTSAIKILLAAYTFVTILFYTLQILYVLVLEKGYLVINFNEYYAGFFLAIQGSYVLFLLIFYTIIYLIMKKKNLFE